MNFKKLAVQASLGVAIAAASLAASAEMVDGKRNVICAAVSVVACTDGTVCMQGNAETFDLPAFMLVDLKQNTIRTVEGGAKSAASPIKNQQNTENMVILQGYENHRGWTAVIDRKDGSLNLSSTGADVNFMITGNCTAL